MTPENFCYWLNGYIELSELDTPTPKQWESIKAHLVLVMNKVTPPVEQPYKNMRLTPAGIVERHYEAPQKDTLC